MKDTNKKNTISGLEKISIVILILLTTIVICNIKSTIKYVRDTTNDPLLIIKIQETKEESQESTDDLIFCSCIKTARLEGINIPYNTDAEDFIPNTRPQVGALVLMDYGNTSHVAIITKLTENGIVIVEGNKIPCEKSERVIPYNYYAIKGFWIPEIKI